MIVKVPDTKLYTVWVDFQSGSIHIYNVECLTFDKQQANKARMLRDVEKYLSRHSEAWEILADKLWGDFVNYKDVPFGDKEV